MLDKFPSLLAVATLLVVSLAVAHEWAYYSEIGIHFQSLVSPTDYLSSTLVWLPYTVFPVLIGSGLSALQQSVKHSGPDAWSARVDKINKKMLWIGLHFFGIGFILL